MTLGDIRILLIDDDEDEFVNIRDLLQDIRGTKYSLTWKSSFDDGLAALKSQKYDACLLDYRLGERTGLELLREAVNLNVKTPLILLTGQGDFDLDLQAMRTGAADYLGKNQLTGQFLERSIRYSMKHALDLEEVKEKQENFKTLFNSTSEGVIVHRKGIIEDANSAICEIFGCELSELLNTSLFDFIRADQRSFVEEKLKSPRRDAHEVIGLKSDGSEINLEISNRVVHLNGYPVSLVTIRDLTNRKMLEAQILQQDRLASLGLLASSLAHEIGTPLGVIRGRAEFIGKKPPTEEKLKQDMDLIVGQIDRVSKLVKSLLQIARGKQSEHAGAVEVKPVIQDVLNLMAHELARKEIDLEIDVEDSLVVKAEAGPLGQVLLNLLVNSVFAIEEVRTKDKNRSDRISIKVVTQGENVVLSVRDTGSGISETNLTNLFKPFFTTKDIGVGTGLGLATSFNLVHSWGGSMRVESRLGQGATFFVTLLKHPAHS